MRRLILAFTIITLLASCSKGIDFQEEGVFVKVSYGSASQEFYLDHHPQLITVNDDGELRIFTENVYSRRGDLSLDVGENPPSFEKQLTKEEVQEIKDTIINNKFLSLDEDLTDYDVMDGSTVYVTVFMKDDERRVGGANPNNENLSAITGVIFKHVSEDFWKWREEVREYLYELHGEDL